MNTSSTGTISGGSLRIRRRPSTRVVSLPSACVLSWVWALASIASTAWYRSALTWDRNVPIVSSMSRCAYHTVSSGCSANPRIAVR